MTFISRKDRVFRTVSDAYLDVERIEGRLKRYSSSTDARGWCDDVEQRRQHILKQMLGGPSKCEQNIVPLDIMMHMFTRRADDNAKRLAELSRCILNAVEPMDLTREQRAVLNKLVIG